jgi:hypothetical protein
MNDGTGGTKYSRRGKSVTAYKTLTAISAALVKSKRKVFLVPKNHVMVA